jgi:hypothetical protein
MRTNYSLYTGVTKIKSKTKQFANKLTFGIAAGVASIGLAVIPMASAATTTVTPSNPQDWYIQDTGTAGTVAYVPSDSGVGTGAVQFTTPNSTDYTRFRNDTIQMKVSDITSLSYMTKQVSAPGNEGIADVNLRLYICTTGTDCVNGFNDVLVYEPYYNDAITSSWQTWNISQDSGYWWSNNGDTYDDMGGVGAGSYATNFHLSSVFAQYPNASVYSVGMGTGTSNSPWTVQADALKVNDTLYDFELQSAPTMPTNKDQCKSNGWKTFGSTFKNQGDCVSFVATHGKNQPSGH